MVVRTLASVIVRRVLGLVGLGSAPDAKDIEIAVLRHQLMVVPRQVARPRYTPQARLVLATLARLLSRRKHTRPSGKPAAGHLTMPLDRNPLHIRTRAQYGGARGPSLLQGRTSQSAPNPKALTYSRSPHHHRSRSLQLGDEYHRR
jgi:hypothetical protein